MTEKEVQHIVFSFLHDAIYEEDPEIDRETIISIPMEALEVMLEDFLYYAAMSKVAKKPDTLLH